MISGGTRESEQPMIATFGYDCQISARRCMVLSSGREPLPVQKRVLPALSISSTSDGWTRRSAASLRSRSRTRSSMLGTVFSNSESTCRCCCCRAGSCSGTCSSVPETGLPYGKYDAAGAYDGTGHGAVMACMGIAERSCWGSSQVLAAAGAANSVAESASRLRAASTASAPIASPAAAAAVTARAASPVEGMVPPRLRCAAFCNAEIRDARSKIRQSAVRR
eukprot:scaffold27699_cov101-Isochrysis_galbana.AAC.1